MHARIYRDVIMYIIYNCILRRVDLDEGGGSLLQRRMVFGGFAY